MNEFDLIQHYFNRNKNRADVILGIGDDCALLRVPTDQALAVSTDTLVADIHFDNTFSPEEIGYKSLAVNLSDLAAMGAQPAWVSLALTIPEISETWLTEFCRGFFSLIDHYHLQLIGGDTTRGPLSITVQVHGFIPQGLALRRSMAKSGDKIYVTGELGSAAYALQLQQQKKIIPNFSAFQKALHHPTPRVNEGMALRNIASSAIDISDGLAADLGHILQQSHVGARVNVEALPISEHLRQHVTGSELWPLVLSGGDDYELCFTVPKQRETEFLIIAKQWNCKATCIGEIEATPGLRCFDKTDQLINISKTGYQHF